MSDPCLTGRWRYAECAVVTRWKWFGRAEARHAVCIEVEFSGLFPNPHHVGLPGPIERSTRWRLATGLEVRTLQPEAEVR